VFDPVKIAFEDGVQTYIDGGIADSAPLDLARSGSRRIQLVLVDPPHAVVQPYPSAAAVGFAAFGIAQSRILDESLRSTYIETSAKRLFDRANLTAATANVLREHLRCRRIDHPAGGSAGRIRCRLR
jgi:predicted acylesterase/phospholipase RssA